VSILILGSEGSMGKRYQAILSALDQPYECVDKKHTKDDILEKAWDSSGYIIATPTSTHGELITALTQFEKPILCEKPVTTNLAELDDILGHLDQVKARFQMVYQYQYLVDPETTGDTVYDYFRHGSDGLIWDCLQIIGLAKGNVELSDSSPIWTCTINGSKLNLSDMDTAYVSQVQDWINQPHGLLEEIRRIHQKVALFEKDYYGGHH
jgi:hypothetical protein